MDYTKQISALKQSINNHENRIAELRAKAYSPSEYAHLQKVVSKIRRDVRDLEKKSAIQSIMAIPD